MRRSSNSITNLLDNAVKYSADAVSVSASVVAPAPDTLVRVQDAERHSEEQLKRIFNVSTGDRTRASSVKAPARALIVVNRESMAVCVRQSEGKGRRDLKLELPRWRHEEVLIVEDERHIATAWLQPRPRDITRWSRATEERRWLIRQERRQSTASFSTVMLQERMAHGRSELAGAFINPDSYAHRARPRGDVLRGFSRAPTTICRKPFELAIPSLASTACSGAPLEREPAPASVTPPSKPTACLRRANARLAAMEIIRRQAYKSRESAKLLRNRRKPVKRYRAAPSRGRVGTR